MNRDAAYTEIAHVEGAALRLAEAMNRETQLEDERTFAKDAGIKRLMASGAERSVTSAEKNIEFDPEYMAHRVAQRQAVADRILAQGKYESAKMRARLAVELVAIDEPARDYEIVEDGPSLEQVKESERKLEAALGRVDQLLDKAGIIEKDADGKFLDVVDRVQLALDALADVRAVHGAVE